MERKRGDCSRLRKKKAQVTVFMIVGILLIFLFIFIITMFNNLAKSQIKGEEERILGGLFEKEAMRLYVEDCFNDELQNGLILLGKQGRLWSDQPGGRKDFIEGINGITYNEDERLGDLLTGRVFYGITRGDERYLQYPNAYPCDDEEDDPAFCQYKFPDTSYSFGKLNLQTRTISTDLKRFLINRTVDCVHRYVRENVSAQAEIESSAMDLDLVIRDEGISVRAEYPLKFRLGGQEFFHLSEFDFFYPTKFKKLMDAAVAFPLQWDHKFVDFNYSEQTLLNPIFTYNSSTFSQNCREGNNGNYFCDRALFFDKYQDLSIEMIKEELENGDDLFIFRTPFPNVIQMPEDYEFRVARQNRPPALSYINRSACASLGYDYLVIKGDPELGGIEINLTALDADEDEVEFDFGDVSPASGEFLRNIPFDLLSSDVLVTPEPPKLVMEDTSSLANGIHELFAIAKDEHGLADWQKVRILADRALTDAILEIDMPYQLRNGVAYSDTGSPNLGYRISLEDPFFVKIRLPGESVTQQDANVKMTYTLTSGQPTSVNEDLTASYNADEGRSYCYNYPRGTDLGGDCGLGIETYTLANFENWDSFATNNPFTDNGILEVDFSLNYCQEEQSISELQTQITVEECIPHVNPEHPYPYIEGKEYHNVKVEGGEAIYEEINPFLASHTCCKSDWTIYPEDDEQVCAQVKTCEGRSEYIGGGSMDPGYLFEVRTEKCGGGRGNICGNGDGQSILDERLTCGNHAYPDCRADRIAERCQDKRAWGYIRNEGWCHGDYGCKEYCTGDDKEVVATGAYPISVGDSISLEEINEVAKRNLANNDGFGFVCGCENGNTGDPCDAGFDGTFEGQCNGNGCE